MDIILRGGCSAIVGHATNGCGGREGEKGLAGECSACWSSSRGHPIPRVATIPGLPSAPPKRLDARRAHTFSDGPGPGCTTRSQLGMVILICELLWHSNRHGRHLRG